MNAFSALVAAVTAASILTTGCPLTADDVVRYSICRSGSPITIDGQLDEADWRTATSVGDFQFPWWKAGRREQTTSKLLWDATHLYVSYRCEDAHIRAEHTQRDSPVYQDDCVEVFAAPNPRQPENYFNIEMNVRAAFLDQHHPDGPGKPQPTEWDSTGLRIAATIDGTLNDDSDVDRSWTLEAAIPFANFRHVAAHVPPQPGDVWHLNLNRLGGKTNPQFSQWSPGTANHPQFHAPQDFGRVVYSDRTPHEVAAAGGGYKATPDFLKIPKDITLAECSAVAINSKGQVHLFHRGRHPILCFADSGEFVRTWGDELIGKAHGMRIDAEDNVWVTDIGHHMVFKFSPKGKLLLALGTVDKPGTQTDCFDKPTDIAFGPAGDVFVSDGYGNRRIVKFDSQGRFLKQWGKSGDGPGEFNVPHTIVVDRQTRLLVGDRENNRVQVFDVDGRLLDIWTGFAPFGLAVDSAGQILVADGRAHQILRLDHNGGVVQRFGSKGGAPGQFDLPHMLAADAKGNLFVAEIHGKRLQKLEQVAQPAGRDRS